MIFKDYVHIGVAVDSPKGLMVPVVRDADRKGLTSITKELKERGYIIIFSSTEPQAGADELYYVEHPDGINPLDIPDADPKDEASMSQQKEAVAKMAKQLYQRTQARVNGADDFDWDHAETVVDPNKMKAVTVQVPEFAHGRFVTNVKATLTKISDLTRIQNPRIDDPQARAENLKRQFDTSSTVGYQKAGERR